MIKIKCTVQHKVFESNLLVGILLLSCDSILFICWKRPLEAYRVTLKSTHGTDYIVGSTYGLKNNWLYTH